ncbi:hypothetical protein LTR85_008228 [Meristemomyces frigidus]|nr:hypothetical protein LTR85_008228 [Meristemomyces frigidus]
MLQDDVIAMDGWYHRTVAGIEQAETKSALEHGSADFLYLRLFYTEEFLGWNSEDWLAHAIWSVSVIASLRITLYGASFCFIQRHLTARAILAMCALPMPLMVLLFFAAGKLTVLPLPAGVNRMDNFGCCAQGLVFPRHKALRLIDWYEQSHVGFVDMLTEDYADDHVELRWALTPSVLQHIGRKSSKGDDFGGDAKHSMSVAEKLWNFAFELNDAAELRKEHDAYRRPSNQ